MSTGRVNRSNPDWSNNPLDGSNAADASSVVFDIKKQKVNVDRNSIADIAKGLAEVAYSMGETNDPEEFAEFMEEDILEAFKKVKKKRDKQKKQNKD